MEDNNTQAGNGKSGSLIVTEFAGKIVPTDAKFEMYTQRETVMKALKALGVCWLVALIVLFVPLVHLVVTPLALVAGPLAAVFVYYKVRKLPRSLVGTVSCDHCHAQTAFSFNQVPPPFYEQCTQCRTGYKIVWPPQALN